MLSGLFAVHMTCEERSSHEYVTVAPTTQAAAASSHRDLSPMTTSIIRRKEKHGITVMRCLFMAVFTQTTVNYRKRTAYSHLRTEASPSSTRGQRKEEKKEVSRLLNSIHRTSHFIPICS